MQHLLVLLVVLVALVVVSLVDRQVSLVGVFFAQQLSTIY